LKTSANPSQDFKQLTIYKDQFTTYKILLKQNPTFQISKHQKITEQKQTLLGQLTNKGLLK